MRGLGGGGGGGGGGDGAGGRGCESATNDPAATVVEEAGAARSRLEIVPGRHVGAVGVEAAGSVTRLCGPVPPRTDGIGPERDGPGRGHRGYGTVQLVAPDPMLIRRHDQQYEAAQPDPLRQTGYDEAVAKEA